MQRYFIKSEEVASRLESRESWFDGRVLDASGFLVYSELFAFKTLPEIAEDGNAIIVAEGGMGKSFVLQEFRKTHADDVELINVVYFEKNVPKLEAIIEEAAGKKYIFIDGLDEAPSLCATLIGILKRTRIPAHVLLSSRSIPELKSFCALPEWSMYSLLPYTRDDIKELCEEANKNFNAFMLEVDGHGLGGVCAKPLGCNMLLSAFDGKVLPSKSGEDLWRNSLKKLCAENDASDTRPLVASSNVTPDECWRIASRVALALKLAKQSVLPRRSSTAVFEGGEIDVSQVLSAEDGSKFNECLIRPIFTSIGDGRFRFSHSSYFDFMAAMGVVEYIKQSEWGKLVFSPEGVPYPLWEGVLPWLAARDGVLLERVKKCRPDLLLGSDAVVNKVGAEVICRCILDNAANVPRTIRENPAIQARYYALSTDGCAKVVVDALKNGQSKEIIDTAIDIARRARLLQTVDALVDFFCDDMKDVSLRESVGYALLDLSNAQQRQKCREVLPNLSTRRLKGLALRLLWPEFMTVDELMPLLDNGEEGVFDAYARWLEYDFLDTLDCLTKSEKQRLLKWAIDDVKRDDLRMSRIFSVKLGVFLYCWCNEFRKENFELFANGLAAYAKIHFSPFVDKPVYEHLKNNYGGKEYDADVKRRRQMARFIVENEAMSLSPLTNYCIQLIQQGDIDFMINEIRNSNVDGCCKRWVSCLSWYAGGIELPKCADTWDWLHGEYPEFFRCDANTAMTDRRNSERKYQAIKRSGQKRQADRERRNEEIRAHNAKWAHEKLRSGEASKWFYQIMYVVYSQTPKGGVNFGLDFRDSALWPTFSQQNLDVLVPAAYDFIISCEGPWSKENEYHPPYVQAFYLLTAYDTERLSKLPPAAWRKFAPELFQCLDIGTFDLVALTLRFFAEHQPDVFFEELSKRFRLQLNQGKFVELYKFKTVLQGDIFRNLLASLDVESLTDIQRRGLYDEFWQLDAQQTAEYINTSRYANMPLDKWGVQTSVLVLASAPEQRFSELLNLLRQNKEWGRAWIIQILGHEDYRHCTIAGMLGRLAVAQLKDFYAWLLINFPAEQAPHRTGCYEPDIMDHVYEGISRVFNELVSRVDPALPRALDSLAEQFPNLRYLCEWAFRSRRALLDYECPTYNIQDIKKLLNSKNGEVIVNTANDLLDVVCGVLRKYQVYLTGKESPRVCDLWNELKSDKSVVSHKDEASFSNHIKSFLDRELPNVVINREVQLNLGTKGKSGARTDIWVTAISKTDNMRLRLCIEVKGSWNKTCRTALREQLCGKYMGDGGADAGVLLVGWFHSSRCKKNDKVWGSMDAMQECLKSQGDALRKEGFNVCPLVIDCSY